MRSLRFVVVGAMFAMVLAACGPPPSTPGPVGPTEPPVVPRMLTAPFGGTGMAAISSVSGTYVEDGYFLSTASAHRKLDVDGDTEDRELLFDALGQLDPATGRVARTISGPDPLGFGICDSAAADAACTPLPEHDDFGNPRYSSDGSKLVISKFASESDPVNRLRVIDAATYETILEIADDRLVAGAVGAAWSPDSSQLAIAIDGGLATLAVAAGAEPVMLLPEGHGYPPVLRQIGGIVAWTPQGRIVTVWGEIDWATFPVTRSAIETVAPDGSEMRDLGVVPLDGSAVAAPDGSIVFSAETGITGWGSVPARLADQVGAVPQVLAALWTFDDEPLGYREAGISVLGFTSASAL